MSVPRKGHRTGNFRRRKPVKNMAERKRERQNICLCCLIFVTANVILSAARAGFLRVGSPEGFTVRLKIGDKVVSEKIYTDAQLRAMKQTRQVYSGINEDEYPCATAAEGILLSDLAEAQGVDPSEIESVSIYGAGKWTRNMTNNYLYGVKQIPLSAFVGSLPP